MSKSLPSKVVFLIDRVRQLETLAALSQQSAPPSPPSSDELSTPNKVFVSYSHADKVWVQCLQVHLKPLEREGSIILRADTKIKAGDRWREEIKKAIDSAKVAVPLVSAGFLASDFIADNELLSLLIASEKRGTKIMAIILSPCRYMQTSLSQFQTVNDPSDPLLAMKRNRQEKVFVKVVEAIGNTLSYLLRHC